MAGRPSKEGLDYFPLDCHMEDSIKLIQAEFGLKGFAVVVKLLQKIYGDKGYYCEWNKDVLLLFMAENAVPSDSKNMIEEILSACIKRNIFSRELYESYGILTSRGIQKRYLVAVYERKQVEMKKEYLLVDVTQNQKNVVVNSIYPTMNNINPSENEQSKGKEKKVKESKGNNIYFPGDESLNQSFADYVEMRKQLKKPMTEKAVDLAIKKLTTLSTSPLSDNMDNDMAIQILEQSVLNSWLGLFPLKEDKSGGQKNSGIDWSRV